MTTGASTESWDSLRKDARRLESELDSKLVAFSKLAVAISSSSASGAPPPVGASKARADGGGASHEGLTQRRAGAEANGSASTGVEAMSMELEALIVRLGEVVDAMGRYVTPTNDVPSAGGGPGGAVSHSVAVPGASHTLQRHSEILNDYKGDFRRTKAVLASTRERNDLFAGTRARVQGGSTAGGGDALFVERAALMGASAGVDSAVDKGLTLRDELERQRQNFASVMERVEVASEKMPALNRVIVQIKRKKKRDVIIMAAVVAVLLFITLFFKIF
uniref:Golgi SNAP receptor complex member 1 n=1 Tax=Erythrolobus madagascarensis TaxID=708628 RepID=A0A6T9YWS2_9RHOD|mmetsp:Transcript_3999/g.8812  ORF Transcript_3999/g.8812 Transcript_3999/m.8812 type:complete len:277 (+) Transcript_3999:154-984(+)|eukprot:CAMPEP_0185851368 /NCGR_PEP_ID=MMETSP1354-20130828/9110_1 /TAXON_ID=708628 /ORGANISM="Erythrolobus madagascarensis, Strain CCMP3276" /LENGTH=276 /DNA_ID=CAMNT_0028552341 /DNA_START=132 /DNA_END=962 /DNA_ORIENTATION=+